jgi:tetratricopeptide (TPR) repeat protein
VIPGYFLGILFWPAGISSCFKKPFESLTTLSAFPVSIKTMFEGEWIWSNNVPWYYIPKYILISSPEIVLVLVLIGLISWKGMSKQYNWRRLLLVLFSAAFPIFYIAYKKSPLYTGWRHSYFTYVPLAVFAAITLIYLIDSQKEKIRQYAVMGLFAIGVLLPFKFIVANYPNHYIYFNTLSGGINKAYGEYEIDYYHHSIMSAAKWIYDNHRDWLLDTNLIFTSNAPWTFVQDVHMLEPKFSTSQYSRYRDIKNNQISEAEMHLTKALQYDPNNEVAMINLGLTFLQTNRNKEAIDVLNKALEINPESHMALNYSGYAYAGSGNAIAAIEAFEKLIVVVPNMSEPYNLLARLYAQLGDRASAAKYEEMYRQMKANGM